MPNLVLPAQHPTCRVCLCVCVIQGVKLPKFKDTSCIPDIVADNVSPFGWIPESRFRVGKIIQTCFNSQSCRSFHEKPREREQKQLGWFHPFENAGWFMEIALSRFSLSLLRNATPHLHQPNRACFIPGSNRTARHMPMSSWFGTGQRIHVWYIYLYI